MFHKKTTANFITITFAILIIVQVFGFLIMNISPEDTNVASAKLEKGFNPLDDLQVKIPGLDKIPNQEIICNANNACSVPWIGIYISAIYQYAIGSVGLLAVVMMMFAGMLRITAAGNTEQISKSNSYMASALTGLVLALTSWMILFQVNPDLITLKPINVVKVGVAPDTGCCAKDDKFLGNISNEECSSKNGIWGGKGALWNSNDKNCKIQVLGKEGAVCEETKNCESGLTCINKRCKYEFPVEGQICNEGKCSTRYCYGNVTGNPGTCYDGSFNDPCYNAIDCISNKCINILRWNTCMANEGDYNLCFEESKQENYLIFCTEATKTCGCL